MLNRHDLFSITELKNLKMSPKTSKDSRFDDPFWWIHVNSLGGTLLCSTTLPSEPDCGDTFPGAACHKHHLLWWGDAVPLNCWHLRASWGALDLWIYEHRSTSSEGFPNSALIRKTKPLTSACKDLLLAPMISWQWHFVHQESWKSRTSLQKQRAKVAWPYFVIERNQFVCSLTCSNQHSEVQMPTELIVT